MQLGLVVDLTNSYRYYRPEDWESLGISYYKVRALLLAEKGVSQQRMLLRFCQGVLIVLTPLKRRLLVFRQVWLADIM